MKVNRKGSGLAVVLITVTGIAIILASVLGLAMHEKRTNYAYYAHIESQNAAEAVLNYGLAELWRRFNSQTSFPTTELHPTSGDPLVLPAEFFDQFDGTGDDSLTQTILPAEPYDPTVPWGDQSIELIGGVIPPGTWRFIDPAIYDDDTFNNRWVYSRGIRVYAKATVEDIYGNEKVTYATQELEVRDAPMFSHAIFYNMDMEIAPGPAMEVHGPTHANGDMYIQANASLDFYDNVSSAGDILHGPKSGFGKSTASGRVSFPDRDDNLIEMSQSGTWIDSTLSDWRETATALWDNRVRSIDHGVPVENPAAIDDYVPDDPSTSATDETQNYGYQLIQPATNNTASNYNPDIESQKFSYLAGLTVEIDSAQNVTVYTFDRDLDGNVLYDAAGEPRKTALALSDPDIVTVQPFAPDPTTGGVASGLYDKRRGKSVNLVEVDVGRLKASVEANDPGQWGGTQPEDFWNGIVYVKFPYSSGSPRPDGVQPSIDNWGLKVKNGQDIPNPGFSPNPGMTLATNNVMYLEGHYNADGLTSTGSSTDVDDSSEPPAALAADAINVLSTSWDDSVSNDSNLSNRVASSFTEVSAALLTGLAPSDKNDNNRYSGGVENFPRFLESWSGRTLRYRGSLVSLFESEIATEPWGSGGVYNAPNRDWGFNLLYREVQPPGPYVRSQQKRGFRILNQEEWEAAMTQLESDLGI